MCILVHCLYVLPAGPISASFTYRLCHVSENDISEWAWLQCSACSRHASLLLSLATILWLTVVHGKICSHQQGKSGRQEDATRRGARISLRTPVHTLSSILPFIWGLSVSRTGSTLGATDEDRQARKQNPYSNLKHALTLVRCI